MQRQKVAEHHDATLGGRMGERGGDDVGRGHQPVDVLVMLVEHHAIEADLRGIDQLVDVFTQQAARLLLVPECVWNRDPTRVMLLVEVRGQMRVGHEVPAIELDRLHHFVLPSEITIFVVATRHSPGATAPESPKTWPHTPKFLDIDRTAS